MKERIRTICKDVEENNDVKILFAIENGSRAWRMESEDSDYDVRFVFARSTEHYISLKKKRDVIEAFYDEEGKKCNASEAFIDMVGFDLFKYLKLLAKSNPTTIEWLMTDIVYYGDQNKVFKSFAENKFNPKALFYHYKSMCKNNYLKYLKSGDKVTYKKYLYAYRGLVNAKWVLYKDSIPPMKFPETLKKSVGIIPEKILSKLKDIIKLKKKGKEEDIIDNIPEMDRFIEEFLDSNEEPPSRKSKSVDKLDEELKRIILE